MLSYKAPLKKLAVLAALGVSCTQASFLRNLEGQFIIPLNEVFGNNTAGNSTADNNGTAASNGTTDSNTTVPVIPDIPVTPVSPSNNNNSSSNNNATTDYCPDFSLYLG